MKSRLLLQRPSVNFGIVASGVSSYSLQSRSDQSAGQQSTVILSICTFGSFNRCYTLEN